MDNEIEKMVSDITKWIENVSNTLSSLQLKFGSEAGKNYIEHIPSSERIWRTSENSIEWYTEIYKFSDRISRTNKLLECLGLTYTDLNKVRILERDLMAILATPMTMLEKKLPYEDMETFAAILPPGKWKQDAARINFSRNN